MGIGIAVTLVGIFSTFVIAVCICIGMIKIMPLIKLITRIINVILPGALSTMEGNLRKSYTISGNLDLPSDRYIYMWHPHGMFSSSMFFHTSTGITNWPSHLRHTKCVSLNSIKWLPFTNEIFEEYGAIFSDYHTMKETLEEGYSIAVSPGGMREMLYEDTVLLNHRRGIFKMALETGTPLVPIITSGDNKLWELIDIPGYIQDMLKPYDICIPIPTLKSLTKSLALLYSPLKDPVNSILGEPIMLEKIESPTEDDIRTLREKYISILKEMYTKELGRELKVA